MTPGLGPEVGALFLDLQGRKGDLLQSVVDVTRRSFAAMAASIMRFDSASEELVFEAVSGEGSTTLPGTRMSGRLGIAGWVLASQEPLVVENVASDPRWARDVAERSGYLPTAIMSAPLSDGEQPSGVINVLDRAPGRLRVNDLELLAALAQQASQVLSVVEALRRAQAVTHPDHTGSAAAALVAALNELGPSRQRDADQLLRSLSALIAHTEP